MYGTTGYSKLTGHDPDHDVNETPGASHSGTGLGIDATQDITIAEHELGFWEAVKQYPSAVLWALFFCIAVIMAGFDAQMITSFYALPAFQRKFGYEYEGSYIISAPWQIGLGMGNPIGQILGSLASSYPLEHYGRKLTLATCCIYSILCIFLQFFSSSLPILCLGEVLGGLAYGFYVVIAPLYASEVCPLALRGVLTACTNLAFVIGQFVGQGLAAGMEGRSDEWAYKLPFAVQWIWPVVLLIGLPFAPESPYWLVRQGRLSEARTSLESLTSSQGKHVPDIDALLIMIEQTDRLERKMEETTSYQDCFRGSNAKRTEISIMVYLIQVIGGNPLIGYANFFFEQAGLNPADAFKMGVGNTALGFIGTCLSWPLMSYIGRRTIYLHGLLLTTTLLILIGTLSLLPPSPSPSPSHPLIIWTQSTLLQTWTLIYQTTLGPLTFVLLSEISSTRLRSPTIAIATAVQAGASIATTVAMPYMLNTDQADWKGKTGFLFGGVGVGCWVWCWERLPETRGRTFEEIDVLFERGVASRRFGTYDIIFEEEEEEEEDRRGVVGSGS